MFSILGNINTYMKDKQYGCWPMTRTCVTCCIYGNLDVLPDHQTIALRRQEAKQKSSIGFSIKNQIVMANSIAILLIS